MTEKVSWKDEHGDMQDRPVIADWWFTHYVYRQMPAVLPEVDKDASALVMRMRRATGILLNAIQANYSGESIASSAGQRILMTVGIVGNLTQVQVAQLTGMSTAAVSSAVRTLVADRLLSRERDSQDRRALRLSMTEAGREEWTKHFVERNQFEKRILEALDDDEVRELHRILEKLMMFAAEHRGGVLLEDSDRIE